jgi:hypothetical protein
LNGVFAGVGVYRDVDCPVFLRQVACGFC